ncbi:MAG TPA: hypothetical protein VK438_06935 [Xanthobacteraceae bacterium]|nr:hypothetical protein [Xanthobacteraceae bacterium]
MLKSALLATGTTVALLATGLSASAQGENNPWDIRERTAYVVMMDGTTRTMAISDRGIGDADAPRPQGPARDGVLHE